MKGYTGHVYMVTQTIDGETNYYSHWERLHPESKVYGVVWNKYLCYGFVFQNKRDAKKMRSRIIAFDPNGKYIVTPISIDRLNRATKFVNELSKADISDENFEIKLNKFGM